MSAKTLLFLCSGGGGNLRFVHQALLRGWLPGWQGIAVITDRECPASEYARSQGLPVTCIDFKSDQQATLLEIAQSHEPDRIITTVHKILNDEFVAVFTGKMLNLHYSLLPAFAGSIGTSPVKAAMQFGVCLGGATVHQVTSELDGGRPQVQIAFPLMPDDDLEQVMDIEFRAGCIALLTALCACCDGQARPDWQGGGLQLKERTALINPAVTLPAELFQDDFWVSLK